MQTAEHDERLPAQAPRALRPALVIFSLLTLLTGVVYPLAVTGVAQLLFPRAASGSLLRDPAGHPLGSRLIGQPFARPGYFWSRPSATTPANNAGASSGSNLGPLNPALAEQVRRRVAVLWAADPAAPGRPVPVDLVTSSASGLDPHLSPAAAEYQVPRVARARRLPEAVVRQLVRRFTVPRLLGLFGEPVVEVLPLNLALDELPAEGRTAAGADPGRAP